MGDDGSSGADGRAIELDTLFRSLADRRRRLLLHYLTNRRVAEIDECIDFVLDHEPDGEPGDRVNVKIELRHTHLPKLAEAGLVEYDERSEVVRYYDVPIVDSLLDVAAEVDL